MKRGIHQGAASSVLLFIAFMDLLTYLKDHCTIEETLNDIHAIIHADDTIVLSTDRDKFIIKCNKATNFITI